MITEVRVERVAVPPAPAVPTASVTQRSLARYVVDLAAALTEEARTTALSRHQQRAGSATNTPSALLCATCGDRIPDARRAAVPGTQFCIHCAHHLERGR